jgi:hypothetical protein
VDTPLFKRFWVRVMIPAVLLAATLLEIPTGSHAEDQPVPGMYSLDIVTITVELHGGWGAKHVVVLRGDGDSTYDATVGPPMGDLIHRPIACPDEQLVDLLDRLYRLNFFKLPDQFGSAQQGIQLHRGREVTKTGRDCYDCGSYDVTLAIGDYAKTVRLDWPAPYAPSDLRQLVRDVDNLGMKSGGP